MTETSTNPATTFVAQFFSNPVATKLDENNFLPWKQQVLFTIKGYKLKKHIEEPNGGQPLKHLTKSDQLGETINAEFDNWENQDHLLASWLLSSMSENLTTRMVGCEYSYQIWKKLEVFFASQTRAKINQLKLQLRNIRKTGSINEYMLSFKKIIDMLAITGAPIDTEEQIQAILRGLPQEYNPFVTSVMSRNDPYSIDEIEALLMAQEERFDQQKQDSETVT